MPRVNTPEASRLRRSVAVVGAGAAGLTAALRAAEAGASVTLLNAHPKVGLKLLMSGGSRCNVTHREVEARDYHGGSRNVVARILRAFPPEATLAWFETLGVPLVLEETGKYFPASDDAQTVLDALLGAGEQAGVALECGARVVRMERGEPAGGWACGPWRRAASSRRPRTPSAGRPGRCRRRSPSAGSRPTRSCSPPAGSRSRAPAATAADTPWLHRSGTPSSRPCPRSRRSPRTTPCACFVQGLALEAELALAAGGKTAETVRGSLLFTHFGLSGPAALDLSRSWLRAEGRGERVVRVSFVPGATREELLADWASAAGAEPKLTVRRWLGRRLPDRLAVVLCAEVGVGPARYASQVERERRAELVERLCARPLRVSGTLGYEKAEVTAGGVALDEVDASTLESRKAPGVFLCGELLDVDGRLGGFNFQWAWSSGTVAGRAAADTGAGLPGTH